MRFELFGFRLEVSPVAAIQKRRALPIPKSVPKPTEEASSDFWSSFEFGGTLVATCRCGRTHFCSNTALDFEDGELDDLLKSASEKPEKFIEDGKNDSVAVMDGPNGLIVWGCHCHGAMPFEQFLIDYRYQILSYYTRRSKASHAQVQQEESELEAAMQNPGAPK